MKSRSKIQIENLKSDDYVTFAFTEPTELYGFTFPGVTSTSKNVVVATLRAMNQ